MTYLTLRRNLIFVDLQIPDLRHITHSILELGKGDPQRDFGIGFNYLLQNLNSEGSLVVKLALHANGEILESQSSTQPQIQPEIITIEAVEFLPYNINKLDEQIAEGNPKSHL